MGLHHVQPTEILVTDLTLELFALVDSEMSLKSTAVLKRLATVGTVKQVGRRISTDHHFTDPAD